MAATTLTVPVIAVLMSWFALGEVPTLWGLLGGVLALFGVAISRLSGARPGFRAVVGADSVTGCSR